MRKKDLDYSLQAIETLAVLPPQLSAPFCIYNLTLVVKTIIQTPSIRRVAQKDFLKENPIFFLMERSGHNPAELSSAFPEISVEEIILMLRDNRLGLRRTVERFGYLGIRECRSEYFNINKNGNRSNGRNSVVSDDGYQVHCYGGSTTVGQNVADDQTISAFLELRLRKRLNVNVFNFGAGNHTSLHSSLRLLDHVLSGNIPDLAIFLNGFNDCSYAAGGSDGILKFLDQVLEGSQEPKGRASKLEDFVGLIPEGSSTTTNIQTTNYEDDDYLLNVVRTHYATSVSIQNFVAENFGVKVLRFIEPTPYLHCRTEQFLLPRISSGNIRFELVKRLYHLIGSHGCAKVFGGANLVSLVDIGQDRTSYPLYVDEAHFSPKFNELIADKMSAHVAFSHRDIARKRKKLKSKEIGGILEDVIDPYNYPLF